jgi:hypothetical protein
LRSLAWARLRGPPVPHGSGSAYLWKVFPVDLIGPDPLRQEINRPVSLNSIDDAFWFVASAIANGVQLHRTVDGHRRSNMQQRGLVKLAFDASRKLLERQARLSVHNVKRSEWFDSFGKVISRSVGLGHPFADDAFSVSQHGQKSLSVFVDPLIEQPVLLVSRRDGRQSSAAKCVEDSVQHRNGHTRSVQFLLNDHGVVLVSRSRRANPSLPCRDRPI